MNRSSCDHASPNTKAVNVAYANLTLPSSLRELRYDDSTSNPVTPTGTQIDQARPKEISTQGNRRSLIPYC